MAMFVPREPKEKKMLPLEEHQKVLRRLKKEKKVEKTLRVISSHQMNDEFEECEHILDVLYGMTNRTRLGRIAEYVARQFYNRQSHQVNPIHYKRKKIVVPAEKPTSPSNNKDKGLQFLKSKMSEKIDANRSVYEKEKEMEFFESIFEYKEVFVFCSKPKEDSSSRKRKSSDIEREGAKKSKQL